MGNLEYSFDNILKSYIDTGMLLPERQINIIASNRGMLKTYLRKRINTVNEIIYDDLRTNEFDLLEKYFSDSKLFKDYVSNLSSIGYTSKRLTSLPDWFGNLTNLKSLDLRANKLENLPDWFGNLKNLRILSLDDNKLTTLPKVIGNLINLTGLNLANNELTTLPDWIGNLTKFEIFNLGYNKLTTLPDWIENFKNLKYFILTGNQLSDEEKERIKKLLPNTDIYF